MTREQLDEIAADQGMTAGEVVMFAMDRLHREMYPPENLAETYNKTPLSEQNS